MSFPGLRLRTRCGGKAILDEVLDAGVEDEHGGKEEDVEAAESKISRLKYIPNNGQPE